MHFILGPKLPSPRPAFSRGPADQGLFELSLCTGCPCGLSLPHQYALYVGATLLNTSSGELSDQLLWIYCGRGYLQFSVMVTEGLEPRC